ncbi:putative channel protein [Calothrix sp. NIES-4071]|nr:putative channel protein [Calothrix sp. NIES-4071]BAZ54661.1 putative channel protein [Calothrix sp. NIES-4105]
MVKSKIILRGSYLGRNSIPVRQWGVKFLQEVVKCRSAVIAETIGTFVLVFVGTGAVIVNNISQGAITHIGVSFVFGAVVAALIYSVGHISGAHFNPAVTLALWTSGFFPKRRVLPYIFAQLTGAVIASGLLMISFGKVGNLGATLPLNGNWSQSFILETVLTFILMFVIFGSGLDRRAPSGFAGLAIGLTVGLEAACMGPITGASMNPARSFAPALFAGIWQHQWIYWAAPILGAQIAVIVYKIILQRPDNYQL